jgi:hypothetical protein
MPLLILFLLQIDVKTKLLPEYANRRLTVADPFEVSIILNYPQAGKISEPLPDSLPPFTVTNLSSKVVQQKGRATSTYRIKLRAFAVGDLKLPVFKFVYREGTAPPETLTSEPIGIKIASVMPKDMKDINDVKKMIEFPDILPFILLIIFILLSAAAFFGLKLYHRLKRIRAEAAPSVPAWDEALQAIDRLAKMDLVAKGFIKKYYYALSEILKRYIERRYEFNAVEQTTTEIMAAMRFHKIQERDEFGRFFLRADMVKYAKFVPPREETSAAALQVRDLVVKTKPEEKPPEAK